MFKRKLPLLTLLALIACENATLIDTALKPGLLASDLCTGKVFAGVTGSANCSGGDPVTIKEDFYIFASRLDNASLPMVNNNLDLDFLRGREIATIENAINGNTLYTKNYSVIPLPLDESDGRYVPCKLDENWNCDISDVPEYPDKRHYLETIVAAKIVKDGGTFTSRQNSVQVCGASGNIESRIADCKTVNGYWAFYNGSQYGQVGEGNWSLVSVVDYNGTKYEVWRDERTKLIWSDRAQDSYNWYQASGYSKPSAISVRETQFTSEPGVSSTPSFFNDVHIIQPSNPLAVCPDVLDGEIAAGGGYYNNYASNPETGFKGNLNISHGVVWKLPSIDDYKLADVNGIRKVLPGMDNYFWSSTSYSKRNHAAWAFVGSDGLLDSAARITGMSVRCVAFVRK